MKRILADTSSLILLNRCGATELLVTCYRTIVPEAVVSELLCQEHEECGYFETLCNDGSIKAAKISGTMFPGTERLHEGERELIQLYFENMGDFLLIDDRKAAVFCRKNSIPYINALLALKLFFLAGKCTSYEYDIMKNKLLCYARYSGKITGWAEKAGSGKLSFFMP